MAFTLVLVAALATLGTLAGPNATGILASFGYGGAFLAAFVPLITAHIVVVASTVGAVGMIFGVRPDWKFLTVVLIGIILGGLVLFQVYCG